MIQPMEEIVNVVVVTTHVKDVLEEQIQVVQNVVIKLNFIQWPLLIRMPVGHYNDKTDKICHCCELF